MRQSTINSRPTRAKVIHWGFIILYAYGIFKQINNLSQLEDVGLLVFEIIFASLFLLIVVMRYFYMRRFETFLGSCEPAPLVQRCLAKVIHKSMYLCLFFLPLSGLLIAVLFTQGIKDGAMQNFAIGLHEFCASLSYILITIHIMAALYSRIKGEGVWTSMVPLWKEDKPMTLEIITKISAIEKSFYKIIEDLISSKKK